MLLVLLLAHSQPCASGSGLSEQLKCALLASRDASSLHLALPLSHSQPADQASRARDQQSILRAEGSRRPCAPSTRSACSCCAGGPCLPRAAHAGCRGSRAPGTPRRARACSQPAAVHPAAAGRRQRGQRARCCSPQPGPAHTLPPWLWQIRCSKAHACMLACSYSFDQAVSIAITVLTSALGVPCYP